MIFVDYAICCVENVYLCIFHIQIVVFSGGSSKQKTKIIMPANKNALIRYNTIDNCLCNKYCRWTLEDLVEACGDALYDILLLTI